MSSGACPAEDTRQSEYSPGIVRDPEVLIYLLFDPDQWQDGELLLGAFKNEYLQKGTLSVSRRDYVTPTILHDQVEAAYALRGLPLVGGMTAICETVRQILSEDGSRIYCVIDDGYEGFIGHAVLAYSKVKSHPDFLKRNPLSTKVANRQRLIVAFGALPRSKSECFVS